MQLAPELFRALGVLCEPPDPAHARLAEALGLPGDVTAESYAELFIFQLVPYASVYLGPEGMLGGEPRDRVAGFWRALRLTPPAEPDHLAALLGLYATLAEQERDEPDEARRLMWHQARRTLLWEHLLTWVLPYADAVTTAAASDTYIAWARLLGEALSAEAQAVEAPASPGHLRDMPELPDAEMKEFIGALLAPVRSGLIITRHDLARAAREMGLGLRMGERAYALRAFVEQDPAATLGWLAAEAATWESRHAAIEAVSGAISRHWQTRAKATRLALLDRQRAAMEMVHAL